MGSIEPFNRLVKLVARAFYVDLPMKGENQPKMGRTDNRGIAVVVLDALTRRQWVREEDLAKALKLHTKQLRRTLRFLEEEKLITRDHRKETAKGAKVYNAAVAATGDGPSTGRENDEKFTMHTHSYCCLDYAQIYDVVRYRLHRMKQKLKDELDSKNSLQEYICPNCNRRYTAFDALRLISPYDEYFHCENCNGVLVAESDKFASQELGDGDDNARRRRHEKIKDMLSNMEAQLKPLTDQLMRVKDLPIPEFGSLQAWELRANAAGPSSNGGLNGNDPSALGFGGTPMPYVGETKVEVAFSGLDDKGDVESVKPSTPMKVLPPWMIKEGMSLTKEQRGDTARNDAASTASELSEDKKSATVEDEAKKIQDEYYKAYYAAIIQRQQEQEMVHREESTNAAMTSEAMRQVGMKSKREGELEGDDVVWEDEPPSGGPPKHFKVNDLNKEAEADSSSDDDDIDWEDG